MSEMLEVKHLVKAYPAFSLKDVSFTLEESRILGLYGLDGAGKSTILKSLFHLVRPDAGEIRFFGLNPIDNERLIRQRASFSAGGFSAFPNRKISTLVKTLKRFYLNWDDEEYDKYCAYFRLEPEKTVAQLSDVMRVKLNLILAMAHRSKVLVLDDPTAKLDPVSRDEITDAFWYLKKKGVSILFSTAQASDVERCADDIVYIREGAVVASEPVRDFIVFHMHLGFGEKLEDILQQYEKEDFREKLEKLQQHQQQKQQLENAGQTADPAGVAP